jgi:hypothetical protein
MFPLFDTIYKETEGKNTNISYEERLQLSDQIKTLDSTGHENIYAIIRYYQLEKDKDPYDELPYNVRVNKNGLKWEMQKLPSRLIVMIQHFVELHLKTITEENQRNTGNFFQK